MFSVKLTFIAAVIVKSALSQTAFTCSKIILETLEQGVKYVQSSHLALVFLLLTLIM